MLAFARERHPAHSVGHIRLLSSPDPPGGGGEGLGERGGMNKTLEFLQFGPARPLNGFTTFGEGEGELAQRRHGQYQNAGHP